MSDKPFSQACENNKGHILAVLKEAFSQSSNVLEIGSGTGQHAVYLAAHLPHLQWQCADQLEYHEGINAWIDEYPSPNLQRPIALRLPNDALPVYHEASQSPFNAYFSANTAHIMQAQAVQSLMTQINEHLPLEGVFCQYGPFTINHEFSSQSNADFHQSLIAGGYGGYRDLSELRTWAPNLTLSEVKQMPANNLMLVWKKEA